MTRARGWVGGTVNDVNAVQTTRCGPTRLRQGQYEKELKDLHHAYGEAMLELRARKKWQALMGETCIRSIEDDK